MHYKPTPRSDLLARRWPHRLLVAANVAVAVCLIGVASAYGYVQWRLGQIHREQLSGLSGGSAGGAPFTLLIVGSDSRAALAANADNSQFGSASSVGGQRSDTIILARVAPASHQIMLMSIPRDLWVNIPGQGQNRINVAFDTSANLLVQTIQDDLGIPVNHYVEVNFDTFRDISDAVGGVKFYFPTPAKDAYSLLSVPQAGCVSLSGDQALAFVRSRHYEYYENGYWHFEAESDLARIQRQQAFIKKLLTKAQGAFTDPIAINDVIAGITKNLTVDSGFSTNLILTLARDFRSVDSAGIPSSTLPNYGYTTAGGAAVLGLQQPQAAQAIAAFEAFGSKPAAAGVPRSGSSRPTATAVSTATAPSVTVAPTSVRIEVANGTGTTGQAADLAGVLGGHGYRASAVGGSPGYGVATTKVLYAPDSFTAAQQVAASIPGGATLAESPALTPTPYNVEVVTGASYHAGSGDAAAGSTTSSSSSTSSTSVPGANPATYVLPGMPAGATPPTC